METDKYLVFKHDRTGSVCMTVQLNANFDPDINKKYPLTIKTWCDDVGLKTNYNKLTHSETVDLYNYIGEYLHGKSK